MKLQQRNALNIFSPVAVAAVRIHSKIIFCSLSLSLFLFVVVHRHCLLILKLASDVSRRGRRILSRKKNPSRLTESVEQRKFTTFSRRGQVRKPNLARCILDETICPESAAIFFLVTARNKFIPQVSKLR